MITIDDVKRINLKFFDEPDGRLAPVEFDKDVPFEPAFTNEIVME